VGQASAAQTASSVAESDLKRNQRCVSDSGATSCYYAQEANYLTSELPKLQRLARVARAFTPSTPVSQLDMLAGRYDQIVTVMNAVSQAGQHVGLYGERGVGKTSLANVLAELFDAEGLPHYQAVLVNCATEDTYATLWRNIFRELRVELDEPPAPESIRRALAEIDPPPLIVIDELDRFEDDDGLTLMADTVKTLSDHAITATIVFVGVARSIGELMGEHQSIVRNLIQVEMPRMSHKELREILDRGCERALLQVDDSAADRVAALSEGLPHYTHLLGLHAGQRTAQDDRNEIMVEDVNAAIPLAVAGHTIQSAYLRATESPRKGNLFPQVLLACALVEKNQHGFFSAGAIRAPLEVIAGRRIDIPQFSRHLSHFLGSERGSVLQREGVPRRWFYRFSDPILQPYVILKALSDGLLTEEQLAKVQGAPR
jgi:energy-coupling factor transporter ATP-binding protein EcfA2